MSPDNSKPDKTTSSMIFNSKELIVKGIDTRDANINFLPPKKEEKNFVVDSESDDLSDDD